MLDKRGGTRVNSDFFMNAKVDGEIFMARATDLSTSGVGMLMPRARRQEMQNTGVAMQFSLPWSHEVGLAVGRVVRTRDPMTEREGTALKFTYASPCTKRMLGGFVAGQRLIDGGRDARCRGTYRVKFKRAVCLVRGRTALRAQALDLSAEGISCYRLQDPLRSPLKPGDRLGLRMALPGVPGPLDLHVQVQRRALRREYEVLGLGFVDPPRMARNWIEGYVSRRIVGHAKAA